MFQKRWISLLLAVTCAAGLVMGASAAEVESDSVYCFTQEDFAGEEELAGICIMELPEADSGTVMLGSRVLRSGDILTVQQLAQMTFAPLQTGEDQTAQVTYLPIYENRVAPAATVTISIRGKENRAPVAEDSALETYKNLPNKGQLKVTEPEGDTVVFTVTRQPKRGEVTIYEDGTFEYTPKKNKVGVDSFTYTATDSKGNVSREATVTIQILKPADAVQYSDTIGSENRFAAEWMKNTGLFVGERIAGALCFNENKTVSRGEFLTMLVQTLGIPVEQELSFTGYVDEVPGWLKPYLAAAVRSGLTAGLPVSESGVFGADEQITGGEVAVMLNNAMDLAVSTCTTEGLNPDEPEWAMAAVTAMNENGIPVTAAQVLTRGQAAQILYRVSQLAEEIPGLAMYQ